MPEKIKFYTDENVSIAVVNGLRMRGINVLTAKEANMLQASDEDHIQFAKNEERIIVTQDSDFLRLHARGIEHAGIVYAHQLTPIGDIIRGLMLIYEILEPEDMKNHIEFI